MRTNFDLTPFRRSVGFDRLFHMIVRGTSLHGSSGYFGSMRKEERRCFGSYS